MMHFNCTSYRKSLMIQQLLKRNKNLAYPLVTNNANCNLNQLEFLLMVHYAYKFEFMQEIKVLHSIL